MDKPHTAGKNPMDDIEEQSLSLLRLKLSQTGRAKVQGFGEKKENFDGFISFYEENNQPLFIKGNYFADPWFQIKGSSSKRAYYDCSKEFLVRCFFDKNPHFLIFVDLKTQTIYFEAISKAYIMNVLKISDINSESRKTIRVSFDKSFVGRIDELVDAYLTEEERLADLPQPLPATINEIDEHRKMLMSLIGQDAQTICDLEAFLFFNVPVKLTNNAKLTKIHQRLKIDDVTSRYMIKKLESAGAIKIIDDECIPQDIKISQSLLDDLITREGVDFLII